MLNMLYYPGFAADLFTVLSPLSQATENFKLVRETFGFSRQRTFEPSRTSQTDIDEINGLTVRWFPSCFVRRTEVPEVQSSPAPVGDRRLSSFFRSVGTGEVQRRIISWELARGAQRNLTKGQL
jgi:hypothetical protein